jgi:alkylhydroperoxidase/carboxymuconolactone decarboxylase family protein YurZ
MREVSPFEVFSETFPEVTSTYRALKSSYGAAGALDEKTKHLIQTAIMVATGSESGTRDSAQRAIESGASRDEVIQAVLMVLGPAGMSRTDAGLRWALDVLGAAVSA